MHTYSEHFHSSRWLAKTCRWLHACLKSVKQHGVLWNAGVRYSRAAMAELFKAFSCGRDICATHEWDTASTTAALMIGCAALLQRVEVGLHAQLHPCFDA